MAWASFLVRGALTVLLMYSPLVCRSRVVSATLSGVGASVGICTTDRPLSVNGLRQASHTLDRSAYLLRKWGFSLSLIAGLICPWALASALASSVIVSLLSMLVAPHVLQLAAMRAGGVSPSSSPSGQ